MLVREGPVRLIALDAGVPSCHDVCRLDSWRLISAVSPGRSRSYLICECATPTTSPSTLHPPPRCPFRRAEHVSMGDRADAPSYNQPRGRSRGENFLGRSPPRDLGIPKIVIAFLILAPCLRDRPALIRAFLPFMIYRIRPTRLSRLAKGREHRKLGPPDAQP